MKQINSLSSRVYPALFFSFIFFLSTSPVLTAQVPFAVYLEAECAEVGQNWETSSDDNASNGSYVMADTSRLLTPPEDIAANKVTFRLSVQEADDYFIWARVNGSAPDNDSYWVRVNGGDWIEWSRRIGDAEGWNWRQVVNSPYTAEAGEMVIDFAFRESNTQLDKLFVTTLNLTPKGMSAPAINCDEKTDCERYPEACENQVWIEAECGNAGDSWRYLKRDSVSNGGYILSGVDNQITVPTTTDSPNTVSFTTQELAAGTYNLYFRMNARADDNNSFWVKMDDGDWINFGFELNGDLLLTDDFEWKRVTTATDSTSFDLAAGNHTIYVSVRENGTYLDKIFLGMQDTVPTGFGSFSLNCMENDITPIRPSLDLAADLAVFPNPASNQVNFRLATETIGRLEASVYDFSGRRLQTQSFDKSTRTMTQDVDVSNLPRGVYQLVITTDAGVVSRSFVKQ